MHSAFIETTDFWYLSFFWLWLAPLVFWSLVSSTMATQCLPGLYAGFRVKVFWKWLTSPSFSSRWETSFWRWIKVGKYLDLDWSYLEKSTGEHGYVNCLVGSHWYLPRAPFKKRKNFVSKGDVWVQTRRSDDLANIKHFWALSEMVPPLETLLRGRQRSITDTDTGLSGR